jgi:uncharacterized RDD family membrane protein YckC
MQVEETSTWKQEVSRRLAAHKSHKGAATAERETAEEIHAGKRTTDAAARVAARFAKAPSYSQMLADEARAAVRAAEAASQAALHAQAAAESVLASLEADLGSGRHRESVAELFPVHEEMKAQPVVEQAAEVASAGNFSVRWEQELPVNRAVAARRATHEEVPAAHPAHEDRWEDRWRDTRDDAEDVQMVEAAQPIHANLIEFPRELVATRKVRPRLADGPYGTTTEPGGQLSIFEVDPGTVSTEPAAAESAAATVEPVWTGPEWSGIQLDEQPAEELLEEPEHHAVTAAAIELASASRRMMAAVVDGSLIVGAFLTEAMEAASNAKELPTQRVVEVAAALALVVIWALYKTLFYTLGTATPGMRYAGIGLSTFSGERPTRAQRCGRLVALLLSLLPVGLGVVWAIFDDEHLSWHDRLSRTYLRRN